MFHSNFFFENACYMRPHSGLFLSFLAYYMGDPSDQFLHLLWRPPYVFFNTIWGPLGSFLCILYWGPQITFFATIWGPSDQFLLIHYGGLSQMGPPPQISFFACYRGGHLTFQFFHKIYGGPLRSVSPLTILVSLLTIWGPLRSVSVHTFWGPLSDQFFLLLYGAPSDQFLRILYGGPLRSVSSHTIWGPLRSVSSLTSSTPPSPRSLSSLIIWGPPSGQFLRLLYGGPLRSVSSHTI